MAENPFTTAQTPLPSGSAPSHAPIVNEALVAQADPVVMSGASWFWWIGGLSVVNTIMLHSGSDTGFIIGYREVTAAGDAGRVVLFPMNKEGANGPPVYQATAECPGAAITDSVAMAIHPEAAPPYMGMVAVTRPPCPTDATNPNQPMLTLVRFKKSGGLLDNGASDPAAFSFFGATGDPAGSIASPHGLARKPGSAQFNLTYSQGGSGKTWYVTTPQTITSVPFPFPDTGVTSSITASSADLLLEAAVVSDGGAGNKVVVRTTPTTGTATSTDRASAAAIAAAVTGSRGIIASRSSVGGVSWAVVDATGADIAAGTLSIEEGATFMGQSQVGKKADSKPAGGLNLGPKP